MLSTNLNNITRHFMSHNSWMIRNIFMNPRNVWRMQEARLSILAGDLFRDTPIGPRMLGFKLIYYCNCLSILPQAIRTWAWRRRNVKDALRDA